MSFETREQSGLPRRSTPMFIAVALLAIALIGSAVGLLQQPAAFWTGYLTAVAFWLSVSLGCLGIALLHSLTGGRWGEAAGRELRAALGPLAVGTAAIIPLAFGAASIYPAAASGSESTLNAHQQTYFDPLLTVGRIAMEAAVWCGLAGWLLWGSFRGPGCFATAVSARKAALGLLAFWLAVTFASIDGVMSLTPRWSSSMFPVMQIVGCGVAGLAFVLIVRGAALEFTLQRVRQRRHERDTLKRELQRSLTKPQRDSSHDLGNLLQAFNMMWVHLAFSQYLIIWSGDLPHEVVWYLDRRDPVTAGVSVALFALHFVVPFLLLLSRDLKRDPRKLALVAALLLAMRLVEIGWTVIPATGAPGDWAVGMTVSNAIVLGVGWLLVFAATRNRLPACVAARTLEAPGSLPAVSQEGGEGSS